MTATDPGSVTTIWGAIAAFFSAAVTVAGMVVVGRKQRSEPDPAHPVTVTAPDGSVRTHDAADPAAMVGIVEDLAEAVSAIPGMQKRLANQAGEIKDLRGRVSRAESHVTYVHDWIDGGMKPPPPTRPAWATRPPGH